MQRKHWMRSGQGCDSAARGFAQRRRSTGFKDDRFAEDRLVSCMAHFGVRRTSSRSITVAADGLEVRRTKQLNPNSEG